MRRRAISSPRNETISFAAAGVRHRLSGAITRPSSSVAVLFVRMAALYPITETLANPFLPLTHLPAGISDSGGGCGGDAKSSVRTAMFIVTHRRFVEKRADKPRCRRPNPASKSRNRRVRATSWRVASVWLWSATSASVRYAYCRAISSADQPRPW